MSSRIYHTHASKPVRIGLACVVCVGVWFGVLRPGYRALKPTLARAQANWEYDRCNRVGNRLYREKDYEGAKQQYSRMIELRRDRDGGWMLRGWADYASGRYQDGIADDTNALLRAKDDESRAVHYYNRGLNYKGLQNWDAAIRDFEAAHRYNDADKDAIRNLADSFLWRANVCARHGDYAQAIRDVKHALDFNPETGPWWGTLGWYQFKNGQEQEAITSSQRAEKYDPLQTFVHCNLGLFYAIRGEGEAMRREYKAALARATTQEIAASLTDVQEARRARPKALLLKEAGELLENARAVKSTSHRFQATGGAPR